MLEVSRRTLAGLERIQFIQKGLLNRSGTVRFSDGVTAAWMLDQHGRLALDVGKKKYSPSEQDVAAFQVELRSILEKQGF